MKKYNTINKIIDYIIRKHFSVANAKQYGVNGLMMLRKPNGKRIIFGEIRGFRIFNWEVLENNYLIIDTMSVGMAFKGYKKIQQNARLLLSDLAVINVYDNSAEFLSESSIDFAYTLNNYSAKIQHLQEWIREKPGIVRARWVANNETADLLESLARGKLIRENYVIGRNVDMECDI